MGRADPDASRRFQALFWDGACPIVLKCCKRWPGRGLWGCRIRTCRTLGANGTFSGVYRVVKLGRAGGCGDVPNVPFLKGGGDIYRIVAWTGGRNGEWRMENG